MSHDPETWRYPDWMTAVDRQRIIDAANTARAPLTPLEPDRGSKLVVLDARGYATEGAALVAVLTVCDELKAVLLEHGRNAKRNADVNALVDDAIVWAAPFRPDPSSPFKMFAAAVRDEWATMLKSKSQMTPELLSAERERVVLPLLDEVGWTPTKWAMESGVNPSVSLDYLAGTSTPRRPQRGRLTASLRTALNQPALQLPK